MKRARLCLFIFCTPFLLGIPAHGQTNLANLGSGNFNILLTFNAGATQTASNLTFSPTAAGALFGGSFTNTYNWSAFGDTNAWSFGLFASAPGTATNAPLTIELFDSAFELVAKYQGTTPAGTASSFVAMNTVEGEGSGDFSNIGALQITWDGEEPGSLVVEGVGFATTSPVVPTITTVSYSPGGFTMTWNGTGALPVSVERRESLEIGVWTKIAQQITSGTYTDSSPPPGKAFYRVTVP